MESLKNVFYMLIHRVCKLSDVTVKVEKSRKLSMGNVSRKRFSIWWMEFLHPAMWHDHDIDFSIDDL